MKSNRAEYRRVTSILTLPYSLPIGSRVERLGPHPINLPPTQKE